MTPSACRPDSWANTRSPTTGLETESGRWDALATKSDISRKRWVAIPVSMLQACLSPMTTSSSAALPARSPRPLMVVLTNFAPARMPAMALAVAIPRSLWVCTSISTSGTAFRRKETLSYMPKGSMIPSVSQKRKRSPPRERVISISSTRKDKSARLASSPPTET